MCSSIVLNRADITHVAQLTKEESRGSVRTFASGGLFGHFGKYRSPKLGNYYMYAGTIKTKDLLIIRMRDGRKYVISPKNKEEFLYYAEQMLNMEIPLKASVHLRL